MDEYITKPVEINSLLGTLEKIAERSKVEKWNTAFAGNEYFNLGESMKHEDLMGENSSNLAKIANNISRNIEHLRDAFEKGDLSLIEKYAHEIKQLSSKASATNIKSAIFKLELAARRENIVKAAEQFKHVIGEVDKFRKRFENFST